MKTILMVDDEVNFIEIVKASLDESKYKIVEAHDGEEGLRVMEESKPDLVLLDILMPRMDGLEFLRQINAKYGEGKTPVVITSNSASLDKITLGVELGIRAFIQKSNESLKSITGIVERILGQ